MRAEAGPGVAGGRYLFGITILGSACLLFLVQPLSSKLILPWFGGSSAVWITCLLFFQIGLLAGYLYAHALARYLGLKQQVLVHTLLLALSLGTLPILPNIRWAGSGGDPTWRVLAVLATSAGLPYVLLSSTSPLLQSWYARQRAGSLPYRYFALSNAGSLAALLAYPLLVEPTLRGRQQAWLWSAAYGFFVVSCAATAWTTLRESREVPATRSREEATPTGPGNVFFWVALAACASTLLMTVTSVLTRNIAPMPLLWVLPLSLYLLSFVLCFESGRWYRRLVFLPLLLPALFVLATASGGTIETEKIKVITPLIGIALFVCCMAAHGELARLKPPAAQLTAFYLSVAAGGAAGGLFVALFAPNFFRGMYEYPVSFVSCAVLVLAVFWRARGEWTQPAAGWLIWTAGAAGTILLAAFAAWQSWRGVRSASLLVRNFYGALQVTDWTDTSKKPGIKLRDLSHGTIRHGLQIRDPRLQHVATTYYGGTSGIGLTWRMLEGKGSLRMGVIGLGAGTLAAYGRGGDTLRFYDINPLIEGIARNQFTFLADCPAHIDIVPGDARLSLEHEGAQRYDILAVDAFSGDAVPIHLLTREAFAIYRRQMAPDGVLAVHISNHYLDLAPVVKLAVEESGWRAWQVENDTDLRIQVFDSTWVLVTERPHFFDNALLKGKLEPISVPAGMRPWTDDFSSLWPILRLED